MRRSFWKAASISAAVYASAVAAGFVAGFQVTGFLVPAVLVTWTLFCVVRLAQLRVEGAHRAEALECDRASYGFALGGCAASVVAVVVVVVLTQVV